MEKGYGLGEPPEEYRGPSWATLRQNYWKEQANDPNSEWYGNKNALNGKAPIKNGQKIELHHPNGRKGSNMKNFKQMPQNEHRNFHKENGYRYDPIIGWH